MHLSEDSISHFLEPVGREQSQHLCSELLGQVVRETGLSVSFQFYRSLSIRIALVGLEVWTHGDKCEVSENPYSTLWSFLSWRRKLLTQKSHDNAQLIT